MLGDSSPQNCLFCQELCPDRIIVAAGVLRGFHPRCPRVVPPQQLRKGWEMSGSDVL